MHSDEDQARPVSEPAWRRLLRRPIALALLIALGFALIQAFSGSQSFLYPDSYRYARAAEQFAGESRHAAHLDALQAFCASRGKQATASARLNPLDSNPAAAGRAARQKCLSTWTNASDITTGDARYQAIFSSRPGYPLLAAPFVATFGIAHGLRLLGILITVLASLMVFGLLRTAGMRRWAAAAGQVAFLATPLGWWSLQALSEGLFTICALGFVWGCVLLGQRRWAPGLAVTLAATVVGLFTRYSSIVVLAALVAGVAVLGALLSRELRNRGVLVAGGVAGAVAALTAAGMQIFALPGAQVTLQDTFTQHFQRPLVADPWGDVLRLAGRLWQTWAAEQAAQPTYLVLAGVGLWLLFRWSRWLGWLAMATMLAGVAFVTTHPLVQESDRLGVLMWAPVIFGLPVLVEWVAARTRRPEVSDPVAEPATAVAV